MRAVEYESFIFDMDGTLIDSIPVFLAAYERVINEQLGIEPPEDAIRTQFGKSSRDIIMGVLDEIGMDPKSIDVDAILAAIRKEFADRVKEVVVLPGAFELLQRLYDDYSIALATSSRRYYAERILENFDIGRYFDAVVTADDVKSAKPAPDVYLKAAEMLGAAPEKCVVFEDAAYGVMAAKAAGMKVVAVVTGSSTRGELLAEKPLAVLDSLSDFNLGILK